MRHVTIKNQSRPSSFVLQVGYGDSFLSRLKGLMFCRNLRKDEGVLLVESTQGQINSAIHMLFMNFEIGVIWINSAFLIVDMKIAKPWHFFYRSSAPAQFTLEIHPANLSEFQIGDRLAFQIDE